MTKRHRTYEDYDFEETLPEELRALIEEFEHLLSLSNPLPDVEMAWTLQKPASWLEVLYPAEKQRETVGVPTEYGVTEADYPEPEEIGLFLYEFSRWFYFEFDGFRLYFSRFPSVPAFLAHAGRSGGDPALSGIFLGYDLKDVAQWSIDQGLRFKTKGEFEY